MTRLTAHQQKEADRKIMYLLGGFVLFIIFFIFFGFKLVLNSATFINKAASGNKPTEIVSDEDFYGTIDIDAVVDATNSAKLDVEGSTSGFDTIEFYINNAKVKKVSLGTKSQFNERISGLKKGENQIYVKASSTKHKQTKNSDIHTVFYKTEKLTLEITGPTDGATVNTQETTIEGKTDKDASVSVNGLPAVVDASGTFRTIIRLKEGDNEITVDAEDIGGNTLSKKITVKYQKDE